MAIAGLIVTLLGFIIAVASLGMSSSVSGRMVIVLVGLVGQPGGDYRTDQPGVSKEGRLEKVTERRTK